MSDDDEHEVDVESDRVLTVLSGIKRGDGPPDVALAEIVARLGTAELNESLLNSVLSSLLRDEF